MKVLVTGATGFIGSYVVEELLKRRQDVVATSRDSKKARSCQWLSQVKYIPCDLNIEQGNFHNFFRQPDLLIHLAWEGLPNYNDLFHFEKNLFFNYRFLKNILKNGLKSLLVTGTCLEYGMQSGALIESMTAMPNTPYGVAKDTLRKFLEQLQKKVYFELKWVRLFYMYGIGQNSNSLLSQLDTALEKREASFNMSGGEQLRDYLPVEKVAEHIVKISMQDKVSGVVNCCSGEPISIRKLAENHVVNKNKSIEFNLGYYPYEDYEPMAFWGCDNKLQAAVKEVS